jgi:hypothetical protein
MGSHEDRSTNVSYLTFTYLLFDQRSDEVPVVYSDFVLLALRDCEGGRRGALISPHFWPRVIVPSLRLPQHHVESCTEASI